jgi:hypothetical protein
VGATRFPHTRKVSDSSFSTPHGSNVRWSDLIAFIDKLKNLPRHIKAVLLQG